MDKRKSVGLRARCHSFPIARTSASAVKINIRRGYRILIEQVLLGMSEIVKNCEAGGSRVALVTGSASGIGKAITKKLLSRGFLVHICDTDQSLLQATLLENVGLCGTLTDVGNAKDIDELFADFRARHNRLDVLVNNVGIAGPRANVENISDQDWERTLAVNVTGCFRMVKHSVPIMKRCGGGSIINISSTSTKTCPPMRSAYVVSKAAIEGFTRALARELGPFNIRCNGVLPGGVKNERFMRVMHQVAEEVNVPIETAVTQARENCSMKALIEMDEIASMVAFLVSDEALHISGQLIAVDGNTEKEE